MTKLIKKLSEPKVLLMLGVLYTILISIALLSPISGLPTNTSLPIDKVVHVLIHALLVFLWLGYFFAYKEGRISLQSILIVIGLCILYGIIIELLQHGLTTTRQADSMDILANMAGTFLGFLVFKVGNRFFKT